MSRPLRAAMKPPTPTVVFDSYWTFATRRQEIFHQRVKGAPPPWTDDPVLMEFRFTNAYRAADRVSQYLIRHVAYEGDQSAEELVFRVLLFKLFNRISTWELLESEIGEITAAEFDVERYDSVMTKAIGKGQRLYSAAYIMPPASRGGGRKHSSHLQLIKGMLDDKLPDQLIGSASMAEAFGLLLGLRGVGTFLAYQLVTDLNYTAALDYSEMEFVMAGPGARSGIEKCFSDLGDYSVEDVIRWTTDRQLDEVRKRGLDFMDLWGRPLQLIDCQNLFCEVDKYARVMHPEVASRAGRTRIKQRFQADPSPLEVWFPPKWGLNEHLPDAPFSLATAESGRSDRDGPSIAHASCGQAELFCSEPDVSALS